MHTKEKLSSSCSKEHMDLTKKGLKSHMTEEKKEMKSKKK